MYLCVGAPCVALHDRTGDQRLRRTLPGMGPPGGATRRERGLVGLVVALGVALTAGWLGSGGSSAPDAGLQQIGMITLREQVPGVDAVDDRPTMVVLSCDGGQALLDAYPVEVIAPSPALARSLALPRAAAPSCEDGYALVDGSGFVRYRSYDPGWERHAHEQSVLLDAL